MSNVLSAQIEAHLKAIIPSISKVDVFELPKYQTTEFELHLIPNQRLSDLHRAFVGYDCYAITDTHLFLFNK